MKVNKVVVVILFVVSIVALAAISQISELKTEFPESETRSKFTQATDKISVDEIQDCTITYYNATRGVYGYVTRVRDINDTCFDSINQVNYTCAKGSEQYQSYEFLGTEVVLKNDTDCRTKSFVISIDKGVVIDKKEVDFSSWGICINSTENNCVAITCGTLRGGSARNGIFNGCDGGKSCQKFLFCPDSIKVHFKASRSDFVEEDPTFRLNKLEYKEVGR